MAVVVVSPWCNQSKSGNPGNPAIWQSCGNLAIWQSGNLAIHNDALCGRLGYNMVILI